MPARDHGRLPDWQAGDLPEPLPLTGRNVLRTIGPGAILLAGAIGDRRVGRARQPGGLELGARQGVRDGRPGRGVVSLGLGETALGLFKVLGAVAGPVLAVAAFQILRVNARFLPPEVRPPRWRRAALVLCGAGYAALAVASVVGVFAPGG